MLSGVLAAHVLLSPCGVHPTTYLGRRPRHHLPAIWLTGSFSIGVGSPSQIVCRDEDETMDFKFSAVFCSFPGSFFSSFHFLSMFFCVIHCPAILFYVYTEVDLESFRGAYLVHLVSDRCPPASGPLAPVTVCHQPDSRLIWSSEFFSKWTDKRISNLLDTFYHLDSFHLRSLFPST